MKDRSHFSVPNAPLGRRWQRHIFALLAALALVGCGDAAAPVAQAPFMASPGTQVAEQVDAGSAVTVALVMKTLTNPFSIEMEKGARRAEQEFGIHLQQAAQQGYLGVQYAVKAQAGTRQPTETLIDVQVVRGSALR